MLKRENNSLANQIYIDLKRKIEQFEYKPGDRISEVQLASTYGVSRTPIKHSLARLESDEIVFVKPQIGTFVSKIDTDHVHEFFTIRKLLEIVILDEVKSSINSQDKEILSKNIQAQMDVVTNSDLELIERSKQFWNLDNDFHRKIFASVNKEYIWDFILSQSSQFNRFRMLSTTVASGRIEDKAKQHEQIYKYIIGEEKINVAEHYEQHLFETLDLTIKELQTKFPEYF